MEKRGSSKLAVVMTPNQVKELGKVGYRGVFPSSPGSRKILQFFLETNREIGKLNKRVLWGSISVEEYRGLTQRIKEGLDAIREDIYSLLNKGGK